MLRCDVNGFKMLAESACVYTCRHVSICITCLLMMHRWDFCMCKLVLHSVEVGLQWPSMAGSNRKLVCHLMVCLL